MDHSGMARTLVRGIHLCVSVMLLALLTSPLAITHLARADSYVVTNTHDSGPGSLRQAITDANSNPGADTITFDAATDGTPIFLAGAAYEDDNVSGDLDILPGGLTLQGNGAASTIIDGSGIDRVLHICPGGGCTNVDAVVLVGMTIRNGGGVDIGGGILNNGASLRLQNSTIGGAGWGNTASSGGGIINRPGGTVIVAGSTVSANTAGSLGGGIYNEGTLNIQNGSIIGGPGAANQAISGVGGGIYNASSCTVTVDGSTISANFAGTFGGGLYNHGTLTIQNGSTVGGPGAANQAANDGGGFYNHNGATATVDESTVSANNAGDDGGGIYNAGILTIQNGSTIGDRGAANQATGDGGGIRNHSGATATVDASAVSANAAGDDGGGIYNAGTLYVQNGSTIDANGIANQATIYGGGIYNEGTTTVTNSRILNNTATDDGGGLYNDAGAVRATVTGSCIVGNSATSLLSDQAARQTATGNWWGAATGPNTPGADTVSGNVDTSGYLTRPILGCAFYVHLSLVQKQAP
jgi:hypothetical protein